jgi:hypothetical protein
METNITVTDLDAIRNIINIAAKRGAFEASEMASVGAVYNKLNNFLEAVIAQSQSQTDETEQPQGE